MICRLSTTLTCWAVRPLGCLVALIVSGGVLQGQEPGQKSAQPGAPTVETVLRRTTDFYKQARSISAELKRVQKIGPQTVRMTSSIAFQRPNRFAMRTKGAMGGLDVVCDGKKLYLLLGPLHKYTEAAAPASLDALMSDQIIQGILQGSLLPDLCAAHPYQKLMEGVKSAQYVGEEALDGVKAHHLKFTQEQFDWEMWVAAQGDPLIRRVVLDLTKTLANSPAVAQFKNQKLELSEDFKNWQINRGVDEKTFAFQPPAGAEKVGSFMEALGGGGKEAPSPLLAKPAPEVNLKLLDKGEFRLVDACKSHIVMLDFWATWCDPCVQELPILADVAAAYKDKGVTFCAINQQEKPDQIHKFLKEKKLAITVALDTEGKVGTAYQVEGIPTLVLIDRKGVVQSVHVGYSPDIKRTLGKELDALLAGKDLAKEAAKETKAAQKSEGLELAWTVGGPYQGLATDPQGQLIYAVERRGRCDVIDFTGKTIRRFHLEGADHGSARFARLAEGAEGLLSFRTWGHTVLAAKIDGTKVWEESGGHGIDDVWAVDLNGDGVDEVIVGYNGSTGLHVFSAEGKRLWKRTDLANVWHVCAGDVDGDGKPEVVTTSAAGKVHVFDPSDGTPKQTLDAGIYANMVRTAPGRSILGAKGAVLLASGSGESGEAMVAMGGDGKVYWTLKFPSDVRTCDSLSVAPDGNWAVVGLRGGRVCVVELAKGRIIAQITGQGMIPSVAWVLPAGTSSPLVVVASGSEVNAFRVKPVGKDQEDRQP
ncbi:MAG: DUF2092 domain-containing protein [Isosphaeraceae bacterium]